MAKVIRCRDTGSDCDYVARAETEEELLKLAADHAQTVHGLEVTEELAEQIRSLVKDE